MHDQKKKEKKIVEQKYRNVIQCVTRIGVFADVRAPYKIASTIIYFILLKIFNNEFCLTYCFYLEKNVKKKQLKQKSLKIKFNSCEGKSLNNPYNI